jgi:membrane protein implicated in regulation of membrane protease activity
MPTTRTTRTTPPGSPSWLTVIDGWVRDPAIRAFALTILAMTLIGFALIIGLASGAIAAFINAMLPNLMAKAIAGTVGATATGSTIWLVRRRRARRTNPTGVATPKPPPMNS